MNENNAAALNAQAQFEKAGAMHQQGRLKEAQSIYEAILKTDPKQFDAMHMLGVVAAQSNHYQLAVDLIAKAIAMNPNDSAFYSNRGIALQKLKQLDAAVASYDCAITIKPDYAEAYYNRGIALQQLKQLNAALASYNRAITIKPDYAEAYSNRGIALQELKQLDAAVASYDCAIKIKPDYAGAYANRGLALQELKQLEAAIASYDRAIQINPNDAEAYWNKGLAHLLGGDFESGLPLYEWRWKKGDIEKRRLKFTQPLWLGIESLKGKSILLHCEQGLGDTIQFCRYVSRLSEAGVNAFFAPQKSLRGLMKSLGSNVFIVDENDPSLKFDFHSPLLSLPLAFKTNLTTIPPFFPYLFADNDRIASWKEKIRKDGFKIGICWEGGASKVDPGRSFPVGSFYELSKQVDVHLISLQKGEGVSQLRDLPSDMKIETLGESFDSGPDAFMDTAAVMKLCDLVITTDTAVAHLAGALGVPVWVALQFVPDWRWMLDRDDSPWYPTMRLFRQKSDGDWKGLFSEIEKTVIQKIGESSLR